MTARFRVASISINKFKLRGNEKRGDTVERNFSIHEETHLSYEQIQNERKSVISVFLWVPPCRYYGTFFTSLSGSWQARKGQKIQTSFYLFWL